MQFSVLGYCTIDDSQCKYKNKKAVKLYFFSMLKSMIFCTGQYKARTTLDCIRSKLNQHIYEYLSKDNRSEIKEEKHESETSKYSEISYNCDMCLRRLDTTEFKPDDIDHIIEHISEKVVLKIVKKIKCDVCANFDNNDHRKVSISLFVSYS